MRHGHGHGQTRESSMPVLGIAIPPNSYHYQSSSRGACNFGSTSPTLPGPMPLPFAFPYPQLAPPGARPPSLVLSRPNSRTAGCPQSLFCYAGRALFFFHHQPDCTFCIPKKHSSSTTASSLLSLHILLAPPGSSPRTCPSSLNFVQLGLLLPRRLPSNHVNGPITSPGLCKLSIQPSLCGLSRSMPPAFVTPS